MQNLTIQDGSQQITGDLEVLGSINNDDLGSVVTKVATAAGGVQRVASLVESQVAGIADDGVITPAEKITLRDTWHGIETEYPLVRQRGVDAEVPVAGYEAAYEALRIYLYGEPGLLTDMAQSIAVDRAAYSATLTTYTSAREALVAAVGDQAFISAGLAGIILTTSAVKITRNRAGTITPSTIIASAFLSDWTPYSGRFKLEVSTDQGATWTAAGTPSSADEPTHEFTVPSTSGGNEVTDARFSVYEAGAFTRLLRAFDVPVSYDATTSAIYWGALTTAPSSGKIAGDYYFDGRAPESGGGVIRYWSGSTWVIATPSWPMYGEAWTQASVDAFNWQTEKQIELEETVGYATATARAMAKKQIVAVLPAAPYDGYGVGDAVVLTTDSKVYRLTAAGWTSDLDGVDLAANSVTSGKINCAELAAAAAFIEALRVSTAYIDMLGANDILAQKLGANQALIDELIATRAVINEIEANALKLTGTLKTGADASDSARVAIRDESGVGKVTFAGLGVNDLSIVEDGDIAGNYNVKITKGINDYVLGETGPAGGKLVYIDRATGWALEAAPADITYTRWSNISTDLLGNTETAVKTGAANSEKIVAQSVYRDYRPGETGPNAGTILAASGGIAWEGKSAVYSGSYIAVKDYQQQRGWWTFSEAPDASTKAGILAAHRTLLGLGSYQYAWIGLNTILFNGNVVSAARVDLNANTWMYKSPDGPLPGAAYRQFQGMQSLTFSIGAAKSALDYSYGGFTDWYLPSREELKAIYTVLGSTAALRTANGITAGNYWSSSEYNASSAYAVDMASGVASSKNKENTARIRPVRAVNLKEYFAWNKDGGAYAAAQQIIPGTVYTLGANEIKIAFSQTLGHILNASWSFTQGAMFGLSIMDAAGSQYVKASNGVMYAKPSGNLTKDGDLIPTVGAGIIESGYVSGRGWYVKYGDGTMRQTGWGWIQGNGTAASAKTFTYPVPFIELHALAAQSNGYKMTSAPATIFDRSGNNGGEYLTAGTPDLGTCSLQINESERAILPTNVYWIVSYIAEGRWKA